MDRQKVNSLPADLKTIAEELIEAKFPSPKTYVDPNYYHDPSVNQGWSMGIYSQSPQVALRGHERLDFRGRFSGRLWSMMVDTHAPGSHVRHQVELLEREAGEPMELVSRGYQP